MGTSLMSIYGVGVTLCLLLTIPAGIILAELGYRLGAWVKRWWRQHVYLGDARQYNSFAVLPYIVIYPAKRMASSPTGWANVEYGKHVCIGWLHGTAVFTYSYERRPDND